MSTDPRAFLIRLFSIAVAAGYPYQVLTDHLPEDHDGRAIIIDIGKTIGAMTEVVGKHWQSEIQGLVVTPYRYGAQYNRIEMMETSHPVPNDADEHVARCVLELINGLSESGWVTFLLSGSGSTLLSSLAKDISLVDGQAVSKTLLKSGVAIGEMNYVRKHLSVIKGGRLAKACQPASVYTYAISDVPGGEAAVVVSGPSVGGSTTSADALAILRRYAIDAPQNVLDWLADPRLEAIRPDDPHLAHSHLRLTTTPQNTLDAAAVKCRVVGFSTLILGNLEGETWEIAKIHADIVRQIRKYDRPLAAPCVIPSGGETTTTVCGNGRGGRNVEFLLSLIAELKGEPSIWALAGDTGGIGSSEDNASTLMTPCSRACGEKAGLKIRGEPDDDNGCGYFQALGDLLVTRPTRTNVNDFRAILIFKS